MACFLCAIKLSSACYAQEPNCMLGPAFLDYKITRSKTDSSGTVEIGGEDNLGLASNSTSPFVLCSFGFAERYWWSLSLTSDRRSGRSLVQVTQNLFGFIPVTGGINTRTKLELESLQFGVGRTVFETDAIDLGVQAGVHIVDYSLRIQTPSPLYSMESKGLGVTAFGGVVASYKFPATNLSFELNYSSIDHDHNKVTFLDTGVYWSYKLSTRLSSGLGFLQREIRIDSRRGDTSSNGIYRMSGPYLFIQSAW